MDCIGEYQVYLKCYYCSMREECKCKTLENRKDDTMYMEITITKPAETHEKFALTMEELVNKKIHLEEHKANVVAKILGYIEKGEYNQMYFRNAKHDYREACEELAKVEQKIQFVDEENELLDKYWDLLNDRRDTYYKWMVTQLEGEKKVVENVYKDIVGTEHAIWETERNPDSYIGQVLYDLVIFSTGIPRGLLHRGKNSLQQICHSTPLVFLIAPIVQCKRFVCKVFLLFSAREAL